MLILIQMIGAVALLIWGTHTVKNAMLTTFGDRLRRWMEMRLKSKPAGVLAGGALAMMLQSSTAAALLISGLQSEGVVTTSIALTSVLGANLGSALMVRVMTLDVSSLAPLFLITGVALKLRRPGTKKGEFGRILLGLGFILCALTTILETTAPIKSSPAVVDFFGWVSDVPPAAMAGGTLLAFVCFSSLAVVVITAGLVASGVLAFDAGLWFAVGADFGSAFLALITTAAASSVAKRGPVGNFIFRGAGTLVFTLLLALTDWGERLFAPMGADGVIWFHITFNVITGVVGLFFIEPMARFIRKILPAPESTAEVKLFQLDNLLDPGHSLALSRKELVKSVHMLHGFWSDLPVLLSRAPSEEALAKLARVSSLLERRSRSISQFLSVVMTKELTYDQLLEWQRQKNNNAGLRFTGRTISGIVKALETRHKHPDFVFSAAGRQELLTEQRRILANLEIVQKLFETSDADRRRELRLRLRAEKKAMEREEFEFIERHLGRVSKELGKSVKTHALHMELLTLFLRFNSLLCVCDER